MTETYISINLEISMQEIIECMSIKEFDQWLRTDVYGHVINKHDHETLRFIHRYISSVRELGDYEDHLIGLLRKM